MLQKGRVSSSLPIAIAQRRGGCGSRGRWDRAEIARAGGGRPARATPPLLRRRGLEAATAWDPSPEPVSAPSRTNRRPHRRISRIRAARQRFRGWEDGGAEARGGASCAGLGSSSASARSRSSARRIRRFALQAAKEWLWRRLPCSAVAAPRPPLLELQAPSSYWCPAVLIDGRTGGLRRIGGRREAPRNSALPAGTSSRAPPAGRGRPRSELRRRKEAPAPWLPAGWREEEGDGGGSCSAEGGS
jgi:hypothetical protein